MSRAKRLLPEIRIHMYAKAHKGTFFPRLIWSALATDLCSTRVSWYNFNRWLIEVLCPRMPGDDHIKVPCKRSPCSHKTLDEILLSFFMCGNVENSTKRLIGTDFYRIGLWCVFIIWKKKVTFFNVNVKKIAIQKEY